MIKKTDIVQINMHSSKQIVYALKKAIEIEYHLDLSLSSFAAGHYITPSYLSALFVKETGKNFVEMLNETRIKKAMNYLEFTDLSTSNIAELIGYNDRGYFSRIFQKQCGISPSLYRKQQKQLHQYNSEKYVYITCFKNDPMFLDQDLKGLQTFAREYNVTCILDAPESNIFDTKNVIDILEKVIEQKPDGLLVGGGNTAYIPSVNKAVESGIPTVTVDADLPESKRLATVSPDWYTIGQRLAEHMAQLINGHGKVAVLNMSAYSVMDLGFRGFQSIMSSYPEITIIGPYDDNGNQAEAAAITGDLLESHPDLIGITTFDSNGAPGVCTFLRSENLIGKIKIASIAIDPVHLQLVRNGEVQALVGPKRELFTYYGAKLIYDYYHSNITISSFNNRNLITNIPVKIDPGLIEITVDTIQDY